MSAARAVAVCALLALAAHAALLLRMPSPPGAGPAGRAPGVAVRLATAPPAVPAAEPATPATPASPQTTPRPEAAGTAPEPAPPADMPPAFAAEPPEIGFPDAPLPAAGVRLRAYVEVDGQGLPQQVSTAAAPGQAQPPLGFQKVAELGLRQARFRPAGDAGRPAAYCLLLDFESDAQAARLAWLPGAARDAARCLAGAQPRPREIPAS